MAKPINFNNYWQVITENTGYDFSGYSMESLNKRLESFISAEAIGSADELKEKLSYDKKVKGKILERLLINYTEMYRDPDFFRSLRSNVLPYLSTYPKINIWHAGCATGEEVFSLAILLDELNLLNRCEISATDINENNLKAASAGIYSLQSMKEASSRYYASGGKQNISSYYTAFYDHVIFNHRLRQHISFKKHDLISEEPVKRFHLILCRNVFIYFNADIQKMILRKMNNNLYTYGYMGLGIKESPLRLDNDLKLIDEKNKIYRKVI
jgi:chemotaxis protein methyltransferase CheR